MTLSTAIKEAIIYGKTHLNLSEIDSLYVENLLLAHFSLFAPTNEDVDEDSIAALTLPDPVVEDLEKALLKERGLSEAEAERSAVYVMGLISPLPSQTNAVFKVLMGTSSASALAYLYSLSIKNYYVQKSKVDKNVLWDAHYDDGPELAVSINLSKPEKNNKDIAKLRSRPQTDYPKCLLCKENLGFSGTDKKPARENIRFVPLDLENERWYLQYSPYGYFPEHCIVFTDSHRPMLIEKATFERFFDFVDLFPRYFIGSNSDLPIVGGSILNHEHFQGGLPVLPLFKAKSKERVFLSPAKTSVEILDFYDTSILLRGPDRSDIARLGDAILSAWRNYDDEENSILSHTEDIPHSTLTPFAFKKDGEYSLYLILRNNRSDEEYPDGIFHAHPEYHAIKKEGIGIIEAAGLFILPARLVRQIKEVEECLKDNLDDKASEARYPDLTIFRPMLDEMREKKESSTEYINKVCQGILRNVAVYKDTPEGQAGLKRFLKEAIKDD